MKNILAIMTVLAAAASASARDGVYHGTWIVTNRQLEGTMTCVVKDLGRNEWRGQFYGVWQGTPFSYTVHFSGPPDKLQGTAVIDGANYEWTGVISNRSPGSFRGTFGGDRYTGSFDLRQKTMRE